MPRHPKPPAVRQRRNAHGLGLVGLDAAPDLRPEPPGGLLKSTLARWDALWSSPLASVVQVATDMPALHRLFSLYDERERAYRGFRKQRLVEGSMGQWVLNPLGRLIKDLDAEIRQMEDRFGLSPRSRLALGIQYGEAARSLDGLNDALTVDVIDDDDPRILEEAK